MAGQGFDRCGEIRWHDLPPGNLAYSDITLWADEDRRWWVELGEGGRHLAWEEWTRCLRSGPEIGR
jgi:hypothetical protein